MRHSRRPFASPSFRSEKMQSRLRACRRSRRAIRIRFARNWRRTPKTTRPSSPRPRFVHSGRCPASGRHRAGRRDPAAPADGEGGSAADPSCDDAADACVNGVPGAPMPMANPGMGGEVAPAQYDQPCMPNYSWPSYAAYPNYAAVTYPRQYSANAWPYIGPFYPYPQVPLGWRKVSLQWDDGWWFLSSAISPAVAGGDRSDGKGFPRN